MSQELLDYYSGDEMAASTWKGKYAYDRHNTKEKTPDIMHWRLATEFASNEYTHWTSDLSYKDLSDFGTALQKKLSIMSHKQDLIAWVYGYLKDYKYIIPQGSIMSMLGTHTIGSLSNCFVIAPPLDSYGGIFKTDQQIAQLEKRRGGVGTHLNTLRPEETVVLNAAKTSTGAHSFMSRYSNTTREVAQNGRRGALMLLLSCLHPDIFKFVTKKADLTQVTGANISAMLTDVFMKAVISDKDFFCRFPIDAAFKPQHHPIDQLPYNKIVEVGNLYGNNSKVQVMKIRAKELFDLIVEMAWSNGEPGVAFIDRITEYCPEGVWPQFKPVASNPCGEQWMNANDACRLLALNLFNIVKHPFTDKAEIDYDLLYEIAYIQQRLADDIVDLEIQAVQRIINKIKCDPEPEDVKATELALWTEIKSTAAASRRTGCGFTAMADMLAALGLKYDSDQALGVIELVMHTKMKAELDCTIDLAIIRGPFHENISSMEFDLKDGNIVGMNEFAKMTVHTFPDQAKRMFKFGRRNVSWSTVAPVGTVSIVAKLKKWANTTAGIEPAWNVYNLRNKKVNPGDKGARVDFVDQNGDSWMTFPVISGGFKEWIDVNHPKVAYLGYDNVPKEILDELYVKSPYYKACANDIDWKRRIEIQAIVQKYTTNAISSTLNLPSDVSKETVAGIYLEAWKKGLKGITIYRDGCRTGVLVKEKTEEKKEEFAYKDAIKRPKELPGELSVVTVKGAKYAVITGFMGGKPYEVFAFNLPDDIKSGCMGKIVKVRKGHYNFVCEDGRLKDIQEFAIHNDELVLTRLVSGMLRHGAKPQYVMNQIDKCDLEVVSFGKAISRTLKKYIPDEEMLAGASCKNCGSSNIRMQEGCLTCSDCGTSKCG